METKKINTAPITYERAGEYLAAFKDEGLRRIFSKYLGGVISKESLKKLIENDNLGFSGLMVWFCFKPDPITPELFLAFEKKNKDFVYPLNSPEEAWELLPDHGDLIKPSHIFGYDLDIISNHENFIKNHIDSFPDFESKGKTIHSDQVKIYFKNYLKIKEIEPFQKYGHGYFQDIYNNQNVISDLIKDPSVKYIRYYFGFDPNENPNFIRVILAPVGANGNNLIQDSKGISFSLLQKSTPPPPNQ